MPQEFGLHFEIIIKQDFMHAVDSNSKKVYSLNLVISYAFKCISYTISDDYYVARGLGTTMLEPYNLYLNFF